MKIKKTFWIFLVLLLFTYIIGRQYHFQLLNKAVYSILILIIISAIWTKLSLSHLVFSRKARSLRKVAGQGFEERFRLENKSPFLKTWVEIVDLSRLPGQRGSRIMSWIGRREMRNYSVYTLLTQRGKFLLSPTKVKSGDPFGFFETSNIWQENQWLVVLPNRYRINQFPLPSGYLPGGKSIRKRTAAITPHAAGIRQYLPGDSMNRIHWKKTAQRGELLTKEFEEDPQSDIWIILDSQGSSHSRQESEPQGQNVDRFWGLKEKSTYELPCDSYEYAVSVVATIADYFIRVGQGVGLHDVGRHFLILPPEKGYRQLEKILETLAFVTPDGDPTLEMGIMSQIDQILPGSLVIVIATHQSQGIARSAESLKLRKIQSMYILIDTASFEGSETKIVENELRLKKMGIETKTISYQDSIPAILQN